MRIQFNINRSRNLFFPTGIALVLGACLPVLGLSSCATRSFQAASDSSAAAAAYVRPLEEIKPRPIASTVPEIHVDGPEIRKEMLDLISRASDYILIDSFLVSNDAATREVIEALQRKQRMGVKVYVLADSSSRYARAGQNIFRYLKSAGISCAEYNPIRVYKLVVAPIMLARDHRKFWIIDGRLLFLGGANLLDTSLSPPEQGGNRDFMITVESGAAIQQMVDSFIETWNQSSREKLNPAAFPVRAPEDPQSELWLFDQNKPQARGEKPILKMIDDLFAKAEREIWLIQPYTFVTKGLLDRIESLVEQGVEVNLMLSGEFQARRFRYASYFGIKDILQAGGRVWICAPSRGPLHAKAIVVDGRWATVGSANLNARSYRLSKETNVVFDDPRAVGDVVRVLEDLRSDCRPVGLEEARGYRLPSYSLRWLWMQVGG